MQPNHVPLADTFGRPSPDGMRLITGGIFAMGSDRFYPEEAPVRRVRVDSFWIDEIPVTNRQFAAFVEATGYRTIAETAPDPSDYPGISAELVQPGSLVFSRPGDRVRLDDVRQWWRFQLGADWRHPQGPESSIAGMEDHPVVHVAHADAQAYAEWAGKVLPTEAQWEYAARGGLDGLDFAWGDTLLPNGRVLANFWDGEFPIEKRSSGLWETTSPVRSFAPNGYGLFDMIGNVWEWTADWFAMPRIERKRFKGACCLPTNPRGGKEQDSYDAAAPGLRIGRKVLKGGSHLCAPNYCQRYRPAARQAQMVDTGSTHIGFRCARPATNWSLSPTLPDI